MLKLFAKKSTSLLSVLTLLACKHHSSNTGEAQEKLQLKQPQTPFVIKGQDPDESLKVPNSPNIQSRLFLATRHPNKSDVMCLYDVGGDDSGKIKTLQVLTPYAITELDMARSIQSGGGPNEKAVIANTALSVGLGVAGYLGTIKALLDNYFNNLATNQPKVGQAIAAGGAIVVAGASFYVNLQIFNAQKQQFIADSFKNNASGKAPADLINKMAGSAMKMRGNAKYPCPEKFQEGLTIDALEKMDSISIKIKKI